MAIAARKWTVRFAGTEAELERCYRAMVELRPHLSSGEFVKAEVCARCDESRRCYGVRRGYAELYGTSELRPVCGTAGPSSDA